MIWLLTMPTAALGLLRSIGQRAWRVSCQGSSRRNPVKADHRPSNFSYGGIAVATGGEPDSLLLAISGHTDVFSPTWFLPFVAVSLVIEGEWAWNAGLPQFSQPTWSVTPP